ncbi:MAG: ribonuclease HI family protein [Thermoproteota archaeon]
MDANGKRTDALVKVYVDGLAEPTNPGVGAYGYVIYRDEVKVKEKCGVLGEHISNNYAEYSALVEALKELLQRGWKDDNVVVYSDSKLLVNQMTDLWSCRGGLYVERYLEAKRLAKNFKNIKFKWIPREENSEADSLTRRAYGEYIKSKG